MSRSIVMLGPTAAIPRASIVCQLIVKSSRCSSVEARQATRVSPSSPWPTPRYSVVQRDRARHPVQRQAPGDRPAAAALVDEAVAVELHRREALHVEEVAGPQMVVTHLHGGVDGRRVDDDVHGGVLHRSPSRIAPAKLLNLPRIRASPMCRAVKPTEECSRVDLPVTGLGQRRRAGDLEHDVTERGVRVLPHRGVRPVRREPLRRHRQPVVTRRHRRRRTSRTDPVPPPTTLRPMASLTANSACRTGSLTGSSTRQLSTPARRAPARRRHDPPVAIRFVRFPSQRPNICDPPPRDTNLVKSLLQRRYSITVAAFEATDDYIAGIQHMRRDYARVARIGSSVSVFPSGLCLS